MALILASGGKKVKTQTKSVTASIGAAAPSGTQSITFDELSDVINAGVTDISYNGTGAVSIGQTTLSGNTLTIPLKGIGSASAVTITITAEACGY